MAGASVKGLADAIAGRATPEVSAVVVAGATTAEPASAVAGKAILEVSAEVVAGATTAELASAITFWEADALATLAA